jgi:hypothetical protein
MQFDVSSDHSLLVLVPLSPLRQRFATNDIYIYIYIYIYIHRPSYDPTSFPSLSRDHKLKANFPCRSMRAKKRPGGILPAQIKMDLKFDHYPAAEFGALSPAEPAPRFLHFAPFQFPPACFFPLFVCPFLLHYVCMCACARTISDAPWGHQFCYGSPK